MGELPGTDFLTAWTGFGQPAFLPGGGQNDARTIISAWNSGDIDPQRGRFIVGASGGHADWAGNQVVAFDFGTRTWMLLRPPSPAFPVYYGPADPRTQASVNIYTDGTPTSRHTYDAVCWLPTVDAFYVAGGIKWWDQTPCGETWHWSPVDNAWTHSANRPGGYGSAAVWDSTAQVMWLQTSSDLYAYNPTARTYSVVSSRADLSMTARTMTLDVKGRRLFAVGPVSGVAQVSTFDLTPPIPSDRPWVGRATQTPPMTSAAPGAVWDPIRGAVVIFGRAKWIDVYDPSTNGWTALAADLPAPEVAGIWKRWARWQGTYYYLGSRSSWSWTPPWASSGTVTVPVIAGLTARVS